MNDENRISVVINTYNAERDLEQVLESVKGFDEVLICDMESTDRTIAIAEVYGCRVVTFARQGVSIVEPAREFAIHEATCEWVLVVDADEIVTPALREYLYQYIADPACADGLYIPRKNYFMGRFMRSLYPDHILRFFRRDKTHWPPVIHCTPEVGGTVVKIPASRLELAFEHLANDSVADIVRKANTYSEYEVPRRRQKNYGVPALLLRPLVRAFKMYVLKQGFRDGIPGLIHAGLEGYYQFVVVAKLLEERKQLLRPSLRSR